MDAQVQGNGVATEIISECCSYWKTIGMKKVKLGYARGNHQSETFWTKNLFKKIGAEKLAEGYTIVMMERTI